MAGSNWECSVSGIDRIHIVSDWKHPYLDKAKNLEPGADEIYRMMWGVVNMPLTDDTVNYIDCSKEDAQARYDWSEGIDIIFHHKNGTRSTGQEKLLDYWEDTLTFETEKGKTGKPGAWYYCTSQYWFVGYATDYAGGDYSLRSGMMVDFPCLKRLDAIGKLDWWYDKNGDLGSRNKFKYLRFRDVPPECIVWRYPFGY